MNDACRACPRDVPAPCGHNADARHRTHGVVLDEDVLVVARDESATPYNDELAENRVSTEKLPPTTKLPALLAARVIFEFDGDGGEEAALFMETIAKLIRQKRRVILICE